MDKLKVTAKKFIVRNKRTTRRPTPSSADHQPVTLRVAGAPGHALSRVDDRRRRATSARFVRGGRLTYPIGNLALRTVAAPSIRSRADRGAQRLAGVRRRRPADPCRETGILDANHGVTAVPQATRALGVTEPGATGGFTSCCRSRPRNRRARRGGVSVPGRSDAQYGLQVVLRRRRRDHIASPATG